MSRIISEIIVTWDKRAATLRECAWQLLNFLIALKKHNPVCFPSWNKQGWSKAEALKHKLVYEYDCIKQLFLMDEHEKDKKDDDYPDFQYTAGIWNGAPKNSESMSMILFLGAGPPARGSSNFCKLCLPEAGKVFDYYKDVERQEALIQFLVDYWKPEWVRGWNRAKGKKSSLLLFECRV